MRKYIAMALSVVATAFFALTAAGSLSEASFGLTTVPASSACEFVVSAISATGGAMGLRAGDAIDASRLTRHERLRLMVPRHGDAMMLPTRHAHALGAMAMVMAVPSVVAHGDATFVRLGILLLLMLLGLFVLWRGCDTASLGLGTFFALIPAFFLSHAYANLPDDAIVAVLFLAAILNVLGYFGLFVMVDALAGHTLAPAGRRFAQAGAYGALTIAAIVLFSSTYGRVFTGCPPLARVQTVVACYAIVITLCFAILWRGLKAPERSAQRGRLRWVFWATVHGWLEDRLERVLFRRRYALEESLRTLGERAESFDDEDALFKHTVVSLRAILGLAGCAIYRETGAHATLAATDGSVAFAPELCGQASLPVEIGSKRYANIVWREDPANETVASEELALLRDLSHHLAAAIAVSRAAKYERLVGEPS